MEQSKFTRWIGKILATEEEEISCSVCFDLVSEYVDTELKGGEIKGVLRQVKHHLHQCQACRDEYEVLRDLVRSEGDAPASSGRGEPGGDQPGRDV